MKNDKLQTTTDTEEFKRAIDDALQELEERVWWFLYDPVIGYPLGEGWL